jgi:acetyl-CoA C-acetyltransferase
LLLDGSYPRPHTTLEALASLKPSFAAMADYPLDDSGTTYRNLILRKYPDLNIDFVHHAGNSSCVVNGSAAILLASPSYAEINEAFAVVVEKYIRDLSLDRSEVNVNRGSIALGHPIGATGSILIGTVVDELERRSLRRGLVTLCAAGGMAPAIIIERC